MYTPSVYNYPFLANQSCIFRIYSDFVNLEKEKSVQEILSKFSSICNNWIANWRKVQNFLIKHKLPKAQPFRAHGSWASLSLNNLLYQRLISLWIRHPSYCQTVFCYAQMSMMTTFADSFSNHLWNQNLPRWFHMDILGFNLVLKIRQNILMIAYRKFWTLNKRNLLSSWKVTIFYGSVISNEIHTNYSSLLSNRKFSVQKILQKKIKPIRIFNDILWNRKFQLCFM